MTDFAIALAAYIVTVFFGLLVILIISTIIADLCESLIRELCGWYYDRKYKRMLEKSKEHRGRQMSIVHKNCRLAYGTTRTVFLIGSWAIKFPATVEWRLFLLGLLANMQEAKFSRCGWPELCPVLFSLPGGWLVVMRRARVLTDAEFLDLDEAVMRDFINRPDYVVPAEIKSDSFGWLNGQLVAVDYGN